LKEKFNKNYQLPLKRLYEKDILKKTITGSNPWKRGMRMSPTNPDLKRFWDSTITDENQ